MIEEENSTNARNSIPHYGEYKEFKPKGLEKGFSIHGLVKIMKKV